MWTAFLIVALCLFACLWLVDMSSRQERELFRLRKHWNDQASQWADDDSDDEWAEAIIIADDESNPPPQSSGTTVN